MKKKAEPYVPMVRLEDTFVPSLYICGMNTPECIQFLINKEHFSIGSDAGNDGVVDFSTMGLNGSHCVIACSANGCSIEDLGSVNGTFVNNRRLLPNTQVPIRDGDQIRLGMAVFSVDEIIQEGV